MEDVLDLYEEEYDRQDPTVCLDEKPVVLLADESLPYLFSLASPNAWMTNTNAKARAICPSCSNYEQHRCVANTWAVRMNVRRAGARSMLLPAATVSVDLERGRADGVLAAAIAAIDSPDGAPHSAGR
jgi:hypothetical protein